MKLERLVHMLMMADIEIAVGSYRQLLRIKARAEAKKQESTKPRPDANDGERG